MSQSDSVSIGDSIGDSKKDTITVKHKATSTEKCCCHEYRQFSDFCSVPVNPRQTLMCNWMKYRYDKCLKKARKDDDR